ncbi:hypothetical protein BaRGS_00005041 [Batillaria attramentaria]|uniref:Complex III assembly factor LYRM7 n=1 Tax=Batillaria attramentaria TaxID=370345 RepID=A0ABD0LWX6_9CAEN
MALATRSRVLSAFKELHRTCQKVFQGDQQALQASRHKINHEFKRFKDEKDPKKIEDHIQWAADSACLLRLTVVQAKLKDDGSTYEVRITKDTHLEDNTLFDPNADIPVKPRRKKKERPEISASNVDIDQMTGKKR